MRKSFLFKVLRKLNFGNEFIKWIKLLYQEPCAILKNNGWLSDKINLKRGIRQGCPASALLFILVVEVLAIRLKESKYKGIIVESHSKSKEFKLSQYADDICLFLKDEKQIANVIQVIKNFSDLAGPKLNKSKTEGLWLGKDKFHQFGCSIENIKWPMKPIRCLGIYIGGDLEECNDLNWWTKLKNVEKILNSWKRRHLTLLGKITIIKSLIVPKIFYLLNFLDPPNGYTQKCNSIFFKFIWGKQVKRMTLIANISEGGSNMMDIDSQMSACRATWIHKIINSPGDWAFLGKT